ncbi:MAG TPA: hypothetical protein VG406_10205 [Isosphaeraceae bacterium]|jgi:WD40 repeat protein|nr:hypothetical protein [Isosphaeraceae bacterium]
MKLPALIRPKERRGRRVRLVACLAFVALAAGGLWAARRKPTLRLRSSWETPFRYKGIVCLAYSPDGEILAVGGRDKTLRLYESETGRPLARMDTKGWADHPHFHPDGRTLLVGSLFAGRKAGTFTSRLLRFRLDDGRLLAEAELPPNAYLHDLALTPDGTTAIVAWNLDRVERWQRFDATSLEGQEAVHRLENITWPSHPGSLSRDGETLALGDRRGLPFDDERSIEVRGLAAGRPPKEIELASPIIAPMTWSPDATLVAALLSTGTGSVGHRRLCLIDPVSSRTRILTEGKFSGFLGTVIFSTDGRFLAALRDVSEPILETRPIGQIARDVRAGRFHRQPGTYEYSEVLVFDVASGRLRAQFGDHDQDIQKIAISPDGKALATAGLDGLVRSWVMPE